MRPGAYAEHLITLFGDALLTGISIPRLVGCGHEPLISTHGATLLETVGIFQGQHEGERRKRSNPLDLPHDGVAKFVCRDRSERISFHAQQSALYQLAWAVILAIGWTITGLLTVIIIGVLLIPVMIVLSVVPFVHMAYAAYKVNQGVDYRYPFVADLIGGSRRGGTL